MSGAWRYYTTPDCVRHWRWYAIVGLPEHVAAGALACGRSGAIIAGLAAPLLPYPTGWGAPYQETTRGGLRQPEPASRFTDVRAFEGGAWGTGAPDVTIGGFVTAGGGSPSTYLQTGWTTALVPGLRTDNPAALSFGPDAIPAPTPLAEVPTSVPEPSALAILLGAVVATVAWRRR